MNFIRKLTLLIAATTLLTTLSSKCMEVQRSTSVKSITMLSDQDTNSLIHELWELPPEVRHIIFSLFLETSLTYTFKDFKALEGHTDIISSLAFSPKGDIIITGSHDTTARLWNATTRKPLHLRLINKKTVSSVAFSASGDAALIGFNKGTVCLWDFKKKSLPPFPQGYTDCVRAAAFSPDGTTIVIIGSDDNTACLWDINTRKKLSVLTGHTDLITSVAFSPDGTTVITASWDQTARLWQVTTGKTLKIFLRPKSIVSVAFSPEGTTVLTGSNDAMACVWDVKTGEQLHELEGHTSWVTSVAYSPDGTTILTGSLDKTTRLWDVTTGQQLDLQEHKEGINSVVFSPDGTTVFTASNKTAHACPLVKVSKKSATIADFPSSPPALKKTTDSVNVKEQSSVLGFTQAINLDDDSQKECSIQ